MRFTAPVSAHTLPVDALTQLDVPLGMSGVVVGTGNQRQPVVAQLFRNQPTQLGAFCAAYVAKLLAFRALAAGAQVQVMTPRPAVWEPLARSAPPQWVSLVPPMSPTPRNATGTRPSLVIEDAGMAESPARADLGAWQAHLVLRPFMTPQMGGILRGVDLVIMQRVQPEVLPVIQDAFGLPASTTQWLPTMPDDTVALIGVEAGVETAEFVNLAATGVEHNAFGAPTRLDG